MGFLHHAWKTTKSGLFQNITSSMSRMKGIQTKYLCQLCPCQVWHRRRAILLHWQAPGYLTTFRVITKFKLHWEIQVSTNPLVLLQSHWASPCLISKLSTTHWYLRASQPTATFRPALPIQGSFRFEGNLFLIPTPKFSKFLPPITDPSSHMSSPIPQQYPTASIVDPGQGNLCLFPGQQLPHVSDTPCLPQISPWCSVATILLRVGKWSTSLGHQSGHNITATGKEAVSASLVGLGWLGKLWGISRYNNIKII